MLLKQTKIVATISDQRCDVDFIKQLFDAGMNVVRMNTAHLGREGAEKLINNVRTVSNRIAILMDTKGPEVRTTVLAEPIPFKAGDRVKVVGNPEQETTRECISVSYPHFVKDLDVDGHILIDDGDLELIVVEKTPDYLLCEVQNEATLQPQECQRSGCPHQPPLVDREGPQQHPLCHRERHRLHSPLLCAQQAGYPRHQDDSRCPQQRYPHHRQD